MKSKGKLVCDLLELRPNPLVSMTWNTVSPTNCRGTSVPWQGRRKATCWVRG